jgi:hypothetical protein
MAGDGETSTRPGVGADRSPAVDPAERGGFGTLGFDNPRHDVYCVRVTGPLDALTANRVLRLIDARLRVIAVGGSPTRSIMVDLTHADPAPRSGLEALAHAHYACRAAGITFCVLGAGRFTARLPADTRHGLGKIPAYPTLEAALTHLATGDALPSTTERH